LIKVLSKVNLQNPFTTEVARLLERISVVLLGIAIVAFMNNAQAGWLLKTNGVAQYKLAIDEFLFMAGLVYIISQVFKRGVEIQTENDLTV